MRPPKYNIGDNVSFIWKSRQLNGNIVGCIDVPDDVTFRYMYRIKVPSRFLSHEYKMYEENIIYIDLNILVGL